MNYYKIVIKLFLNLGYKSKKIDFGYIYYITTKYPENLHSRIIS